MNYFTGNKQLGDILDWHTWDSKFSCCMRRKFHCYTNPSKGPAKIFLLILSRRRRQPCGGEASIYHEGIKIYWKMLVDCFQNNCYARKNALKLTESTNLAFFPVLQSLDTCFAFAYTHKSTCVYICTDYNLLDEGHIYFLTADLRLSVRLHHYLNTRLQHTCTNTYTQAYCY